MSGNSQRHWSLSVKMFTPGWLLLSSALSLASSATTQCELTTEQAIKQAEQTYGGRVIKLLNESANSQSGFYTLQLINRKAKVMTIYIDLCSGGMTQRLPSATANSSKKPRKVDTTIQGTESVTRP